MLPSAHIFEGTSDNYSFIHDLKKTDFEAADNICTGPMATVLGTSLQNRHMLEELQADWKIKGEFGCVADNTDQSTFAKRVEKALPRGSTV